MIWIGRQLDKPITSYSNSGGSGNRTSIITSSSNITWTNGVTSNLVNGNTSTTSATHSVTGAVGATPAGSFIRWDFHALKYIDAVKMYFNGAPSNGNWALQASNDASDWTGLASFNWNQATQEVSFTNDTYEGYRYYQLAKLVTQNWDTSWFFEVEHKIAPGAV
jgi:hypothetical protein